MARAPSRPQVEPADTLGPLSMIFRAAGRYPSQVALALVALCVTAAASLAIPAGFRLIIDRGFAEGTNPEEIGRWFRYLFLIVLVLAVGTGARFYFVSILGERVVADIRRAVQANLLRLSPGFFEENSPNEISTRMTADTAQIEQVVGTTISVALRNALMAVGGITYLLYLAPHLTLLLVIAVPVVLLPIVVLGRRLRNLSRISQDRVAEIGANVAEVLGAMKIVQGFNQEHRERSRFQQAVEATFAAARSRIVLRAVMTSVIMTCVFGAITALMWRGALQVADGTLSGGTIAAFVLTGVMVAGALGSLTEVYGDLLRGAGAAERLNELLQEQPGIA
ncbi:MAG: ABC transporter transmembrane domain-containing protein, partial [Croceibacterium sp.]